MRIFNPLSQNFNEILITFFSDKPLIISEHFSVPNSYTLTINGAQKSDSGRYICTVRSATQESEKVEDESSAAVIIEGLICYCCD